MRVPILPVPTGRTDGSVGAADGPLLAAFAAARDEAAFDALVRRHGPLVWAVAARHAADRPSAEDAFQATFLTLARVAARLDPARPLAGWLHTVAVRFARKTRRFARRHRVGPTPERATPRTPLDDLTGRELLAVIDAEVARLPDRYRLPLILCGLQGLARDEAAARLGWPAGVLKGRLERAREALRRRLAARGLSLPAVLAGPLLAPTLVPLDLRAATVRAAVQFAAGPVPGSAAVLAGSEARRIAWTGRWRVGLLFMAAGLAVGLTVAGFGGPAGPPPAGPRPPADAPVVKAERPGSILPDGALRMFGDQRFRHPGGISGSALSPDGKRLATAATYSVMMWDAATGDPIWRADAGTGGLWGMQPLFFSPDGSLLVLVRTNYVLVWDAATGRLLKRIQDPRVVDEWSEQTIQPGAAFTPDGKLLVLGRTASAAKTIIHTTEHYDTRTWAVAHTVEGRSPNYISPVGPTGIRFDARGQLDFSDPATGRPTIRPKDQTRGGGLVLSPDGKRVAVFRQGGTVEVWSVPGGELVRSFPGAAPPGPHFARGLFTQDGRTLLVTRPAGIARLDLATGKEGAPVPHTTHPMGEPPSLHLLPDEDTLLVCANDGRVHLWSLKALKEIPPPDGYANWARAAVSADGRRLAVGDRSGRVDVWDLVTGKRTRTVRESAKAVTALAFAPAGTTLAVGRAAGEAEVRDLSDGRTQRTFQTISTKPEDERFVDGLLFAPDGRTLMATSRRGKLEAWDLTTGRHLWIGKQSGVRAISPDGKTLVSSWAGPDLVISDPVTGEVRRWVELTGNLTKRMYGEISALAFAPDGGRLFVATRDQRVRIFDPVTIEERASFVTSEPRPTGLGMKQTGAEALAVSPDGQWLLTGGEDRTVRLWEVATRAELRRFRGHDGEVRTVGFGPGRRTVVSGGVDGAVYQWDLRPRDAGPVGPGTWADLGSGDPAVAYRAVWCLAADPAGAVKLLRANLPPAAAPDPERLARLIGRLGADGFADREAATRELAALGRLAGPALKAAIARGVSAEARERADRLLNGMAGEPAGEELRQMRAVQALELAGGPEAIALLKEWATGAADARLTVDARAALGRLDRR